MKKLATKLLVCSLACSLLVNPVRASAVDWEKLLGEMDTTDEFGTADLENIIEKAVANSVDKSVKETMPKAVANASLEVVRDKASVTNIVEEIKKTLEGSTWLKFVKLPFSAAWNVVKSAIVLALAVALPVGGTYAFAPASREAIKTDLTNLLNTLKNSKSANKISELAKSAYAKTPDVFNSIVEKVKGLF